MDIYRYNYDPVTIEEFLNDKYLGENTVGFIFPWVKETLFEFFDPHKKYRELYLMQGNGVGKTTLMNIALAYMVYLYCSCKQIREQLGVTSSAIVEIVILSDRRGLALERVWAKLVEDFDKYPVFERVARAVEARVAGGTILWSTASVGNRTFVGTFPNGLRLSVEKRYEGIQGKNIIGVVASELSNFSLDSGVSSEEVDKLLMGAIDRIHTRGFLQHYIPRVIIDSTPHDTKTSMLDRRVFETKELFSNDIRIVKTGESWLYNKKESIYPVYCKTGETFSVFCGDAERNPRVVSGEVVSRYAEDSVVQVPVDLRETFDLNPEHLVRVWCGRPTGIAGRYGVEEDLVLKIFDRNLPSVSRDFVDCVDFEDYNFIQDLEKSGVIRQSSGLLEYVRSPYEARVIHCDIAVVRDACAISCVHLERDESIEEMLHCVVDWMLVLIPSSVQVSIIRVVDLISNFFRLFSSPLVQCSFDGFEQHVMRELLIQKGISARKISVDLSSNYYDRFMFELVLGKRVHAPYNVVLKNNLRSLVKVVREKSQTIKVDHTKGDSHYTKEESNFLRGRAGINAKDCSDSIVGACVELLRLYDVGVVGVSSVYYGEGCTVLDILSKDFKVAETPMVF